MADPQRVEKFKAEVEAREAKKAQQKQNQPLIT